LPPREAVEAAVEALVPLLDTLNGDPDTEDCDGFENEPLLDAKECSRLNRLYGDGPGGGILLDSDYGAEEADEPEEGYAAGRTGIDQSRPISAENRAVL
jgi:hypothetical protein